MALPTLVERKDVPLDAQAIEKVLLGGDLSQLSSNQRLTYYSQVCQSLGLNPLTKPFDYLTLNGKMVLYARKDATEQLRKVHTISVSIKARELVDDCYVVTAQARMPNGREDESLGAVPIGVLKGEAKANAMMKAETKAKRRVTLSICGLGMLDETEVESIAAAQVSDAPVIKTEADLKRVEAKDELSASTQPPADDPLPTLPDGQYWITKVYESKKGKKNGRDWTLFMVVVHTGEEFGTFDVGVADLAENCRQQERPAEIRLETKGYGPQVVELVMRERPGEELVF